MEILSKVIAGISALGVAISSFIFPVPPTPEPTETQTFGATVQEFGGFPYFLAGGGISSTATSITLTSLTIPQNGQEIVDSDLSATFYLTLEPGNRSKQEFISCTTVTQNTGDTATLSGCTRGLSPIYPYTSTSNLKFSHAGGTVLIFSNPPNIYAQYPAKANDETITGQWTFSTFPVTPSNSAGSETVAGILELATGAEAAATTLTGGVGRLALPTAISTSTWNSASLAANKIPVSDGLGKIADGFISTTTLLAATSTSIGAFPVWQIGKQVQVFSSTGTTTFSVPSGITKAFVRVQAGGGGGGGCNAASGNVSLGGGGGGGGYSEEFVNLTGTSTVQVYVGDGGTAEVAGQRTTFGTIGFEFLSASGGNPGTNEGNGGSGGLGTGGDLNLNGGGGGGGYPDVAIAGDASGPGGSSHLGGGGAGVKDDNAGQTGGVYGGGGSGAACTNASLGGGVGAQGIIIVSW